MAHAPHQRLGRSRAGRLFLMMDLPRPTQFPLMESGALRSPADAEHDATFRRIFDMEFEYVWSSLRRLGVPSRDLEDITHDVFVRVYKQLRNYESSRAIRPWLFGFAFRVASDYRNLSRNRLEVLDPDVDNADPVPSALDRLMLKEALSVGYAALETMDLERRAIFILHELDGCTIPEISTALAVPLNTAYSRLRIAREQFNAALKRMRSRKEHR
jgi:RNA polymerase sigma-70 factor (ECF subfamily)